MYVYLSKKISIPQGLKLKSLAWNSHQGWLACGTDHGIVKVLKLQDATSKDMHSNLSMNQTLEGHQGSVLVVSWNQNYRKLTTSDENGLIIVWILHKGMWFEEMINNRSRSVVKDMRWSTDGRKICIAYEDGHVVMGNVDGNRIWGRELNHKLVFVEWSPDGRLLLFCTKEGKCLIYDCYGNYAGCLPLSFKATIVGIHWYDGTEGLIDPAAPTLAILFQSGELQLMKHELDEEPLLISSGMNTTGLRWCPNGSVLAIVAAANEVNSMVQLYSPMGIHLRTLHVTGTRVGSLTWEGTGLRLALAVDSSIYLANIRPEYKWAFLGNNTCVYSFRKKSREESCVMFWDINVGDRHLKYVKRLLSVCGAGGHCILGTQGDEFKQYVLILCNAIGTPIDSKYISVEPLFSCMNTSHVFVASENGVYVWHYQSALQVLFPEPSDQKSLPEEHTFRLSQERDHICCMSASENFLLIGRHSGNILVYSLPELKMKEKISLESKPQAVALNCDSTRLAVIDMSGAFSFVAIQDHKEMFNTSFARKDVWNMKWADDNPDLIVIMEKAKMYVLRGTEPEEPVECSAYLCDFHNLQVLAVHLDDVMQQPEQPTKEHVFNYETKSLRDTHQILQAVEMQDAYSYVEEHAHPRLWTSLAEHALEHLELTIAEKAFVKCRNYFGIQFVKGLHQLKAKDLQKAEVYMYFKKFEDAERMYLSMDRLDLAISMRMKLGDWFIVEKLVEAAPGKDSLLQLTWNFIGDHFSDRKNWKEADVYYRKSRNYQMLAEAYYALEHWNKLHKLMDCIENGSPLLLCIGRKFESVGICEHAVAAFLKGGDHSAAIDCCVKLHNWEKAIDLSRTHKCEAKVQEKLMNYMSLVLDSGNPARAIQVHRKATQHTKAAEILRDIAKDRATKMSNVIEVKKMYVLAAFEMELSQSESHETEKHWHSAEAYHLWILAHRDLYHSEYEQALKTAWWLRDYEDVLRLVDIYSLIALAAFYNESFEQCSKAFVVLESLPDIPEQRRKGFEKLAVSIFREHKPWTNPVQTTVSRRCPKCRVQQLDEFKRRCSTCDAVFPICMASGTQIMDEDIIKCVACKHFVLLSKSKYQVHCPLCHSPLPK